MQRYLAAGVVAICVFVAAKPAAAGHGGMFDAMGRFARNFWSDFRANNMWPEPYNEPDRESVRTPINIMIANGWRRENTLNDHHFDRESNELTDAGKIKVELIVTKSPPQFRTVFVERMVDPEANAARLAAVQQIAENYVLDGEMPAVVDIQGGAVGWSALDIDNVRRKYIDSAPEPRLPASSKSSANF